MMVELSISEIQFMRVVAHAIFNGFADREGFVAVKWLREYFTQQTISYFSLEFYTGYSDNYGGELFKGGGWLWLNVQIRLNEHNEYDERKMKIRGIRFHGGSSFVELLGDAVPDEFLPIFDGSDAEALAIRNSPAFQLWLAEEWRDPTAGIKLKTKAEPTGRKQGIQNASKWVTRLTYTHEEAQAEKKRIDGCHLPPRSKAALKAHVSRRVIR